MSKAIAQVIIFITFISLWYVGNLADKQAGNSLEGQGIYTFYILLGAVILIACSLHIGQKSKE